MTCGLQDLMRRHLSEDCVVLLTNIGFAAGGEVLNCNTYDVGLHAAVELRADKLFCIHLDDVQQLALPPWLPLSDAKAMLLEQLKKEDLLSAAVEAVEVGGSGVALTGGRASDGSRPA